MALTVISGEIAAQPLNDNFSEGKANLDTHLAESVTDVGGVHNFAIESGNFTPQIQFGGESVGISYSVQNGKYTKVGTLLSYQVDITLSSKGTSVGLATLQGFPFALSSANNARGAVAIARVANITYPAGVTSLAFEAAGSSITGIGSGLGFTTIADDNFADNSVLRMSGFYITD